MRIGVRDLPNRTAQVIDAVKAGERVVLTVNGEPTADIVPHGERTRWLGGRCCATSSATALRIQDCVASSTNSRARLWMSCESARGWTA